MSGFWIFQDCQFAQGYEYPGLHRVYIPIFVYMTRVLDVCQDAVMEGFSILQDCQFAQGSEYPGLCRVITYFCKYSRVLNIHQATIMDITGFQKCQISAYANIIQGSEYAWIWMSNVWIKCSDFGSIMNIPGQSCTEFEHASGSKYAKGL